ncbi:MAG: ABC-2 family transporter protein [Candidatus Levybacteria bacterium]|nr:ABC-2 family transporter protein [Candidatus Levybacteria bacterium]
MKKYLRVLSNTWEEMVTYRLNFVMWRVRTVLQFLTMYFLWLALIPKGTILFGYSQTLMLTYILGTSILSAVVLSTRTHEIGEHIYRGDLSIFLIRPINYFLYWFSRDVGDKLFNISFSVVEIMILLFLLKPPIFLQTEIIFIALAILATALAVVLYFLFGAILGMLGFWSPDVWAPRFILFILLQFFAGSLFPLDILPKSLYEAFQLTPFPYLLYFPLKIYLGQLPFSTISTGFLIDVIWILIIALFLQFIWHKGLRLYTAVGR